MKTDFLLVGQGLAGSLLAIELLQGGASVKLVDRGTAESATAVSTGIINPLTGRLFALSWQFETLMAEAEKTYQNIERITGERIFTRTIVSRAVMHTKGLNDLMIRLESSEMSAFIRGIDRDAPWPGVLKPVGYYVHINGARVNTVRLLHVLRQYFQSADLLISDSFSFADVEYQSSGYHWKGIEAREIVWCGGASVPDQHTAGWPVTPLHGQVMRIKIPGLAFDGVVKHNIFLANEGDDNYWAGATHEPTKSDVKKDREGWLWLKSRIDEMLVPDYDIIAHKAAMRPVVKDRRPVMGRFQGSSVPIMVMSGLGTKGASLAPWCAKVMAGHLLNGEPLPREVNIDRYLKQP